ncbi:MULTISPECIES: hypothetical protein [Citrobacter]|uniref:Uncharacterized protein n=1 Tax=Citrobacter werkmanii TaxID=67827 RepID=A0A9N8CMJ2_9ENTR|nr:MULTISPECIES: hypothetical protein [Citrobacter]AYL42239.1 hypothetical protein CUC45_08090 [Citrobacter freundii]MDM3099997.1 hypothetical protein [Citrobacter sp. Cf140]MEB1122519.1 hypothetical protein [Citrobacter freundii]CAB5539690.1 Uncharacterised protein [Citrobacter werkmanii]CAB5547140.1 Uncharacterised protein [Citrobacter werkmanii]
MRTWGRVTDENGKKSWVPVETDENGDSSYVWLTTLIQTLKLGLGESPFYAQFGIPAQQSIVQQIYPDYYVNMTQQQFAGYFASLAITKVDGEANPTYNIAVVFRNGVSFQKNVAV